MNYLDSSIVLSAYLSPESGVDLKKLSARRGLVISPVVIAEFASAVGILFRRRELARAKADQTLAMFYRHTRSGVYEVLDLHSDDFLQAFHWMASLRSPLRCNDAVHLAIAWRNRLTLLTADVNQHKSAALFSVKD